MDIKQYIESGILEGYVMGTNSKQEMQEVECMSSIYPELKQEIKAIETSLEEFVKSIAVAPPTSVKTNLLNAIKNIEQEKVLSIKKETKTNEAEEKTPVIKLNYYKYLSAASVVLLILFTGLYISKNSSYSELENQLSEVKKSSQIESEQNNLKLNELEKSLASNLNQQELILNAQTKAINLAGTPVSPESKVRVYWNSEMQKMVLIKDNLPQPTTEKQYQLWAIADGKPVDLGVLAKEDNNLATTVDVNIENIQAFAITLEDNGGKPTPNLEQLYVIGNV